MGMENVEWELTGHVELLKILEQENDMTLNLAQRLEGGVCRQGGYDNGQVRDGDGKKGGCERKEGDGNNRTEQATDWLMECGSKEI